MSKLPIVQYCGLAGKVNEIAGSIRAGVLSKWFHANCGEQWEEAQRLWAQLSDNEREEVRSWVRPARCTIDGTLLDYSVAEKELEVGIDENGRYLDPTQHEVMSTGHIDMAWNYNKVAYIGDIKRSRFTVKDGTDSLQLHAYGFAYSSLRGCHYYRVGIWQAIEGVWIWSNERVDLESSRAGDIWERIRRAGLNTDEEANKGPHCQDCWGRLKCPAYTLDAALGTTELAPLVNGGLTPENAVRALQLAESMVDLGSSVIEACKAYVAQGGKIADGKGRSYRPIKSEGREYVTTRDVRAKFGSAAESVIRRSKPGERWGWYK